MKFFMCRVTISSQITPHLLFVILRIKIWQDLKDYKFVDSMYLLENAYLSVLKTYEDVSYKWLEHLKYALTKLVTIILSVK